MKLKFIISQPMRGKSIEKIREERLPIIEMLERAGHEVIDNIYIKNDDDFPDTLQYLGRTLIDMADCDGIVFMNGFENDRLCLMTYIVSQNYCIKIYHESKLAKLCRPGGPLDFTTTMFSEVLRSNVR